MDKFKQYIQQHSDELGNDAPGEKVWQQVNQKMNDSVSQESILTPSSTAVNSQQMKRSRKPFIKMMIRYAAAACVIGLAGIGAWHLYIETQKHNKVVISTMLAKDTNHLVKQGLENNIPSGKIVTPNLREITVSKIGKKKAKKFTNRLLSEPSTTSFPSNPELSNMENSFTQVINIQKLKLNSLPLYAENSDYFSDFKMQLIQMGRDEETIKRDIAHLGLTNEMLAQLINIYQQKLNVLKLLQNEINKTNSRYKQTLDPVTPQKTYFLHL